MFYLFFYTLIYCSDITIVIWSKFDYSWLLYPIIPDTRLRFLGYGFQVTKYDNPKYTSTYWIQTLHVTATVESKTTHCYTVVRILLKPVDDSVQHVYCHHPAGFKKCSTFTLLELAGMSNCSHRASNLANLTVTPYIWHFSPLKTAQW